ncbi:MAG TPA: P-loop NTPase fold protein, partial [Thermoanaerobaculia bacterium]|nr:P-loop NTPase fold protein [Thermoanaerobaculia bacterium]
LTGFRHQFAAEFRDITHALNPRTMVVMVDDLDRCKPEMVLEVLESINFLVSSGDCYVVLGMARERVIRCVGLSFKDVASELLVTQMSPEEKEEKVDADELARRRRIEFATQYLEKLINIEVPVPAPTYAQSRRLLQESAPKDEAPEARRDYLWRTSWRGLRRVFPVAAAVVLLFAGYWLGASRVSKRKPDLPEPVQAASPVTSPTQVPAAPSGRDVAQTGSVASRQPAEIEAAEEASFPLFIADILFWALVGLGVWRLSVPPGVVIRDSQEFEEALETWHPLIFTFRKTPRSIKRFLNRVRYLAMLQRGQDPEPSRWRQALAWLRGIFRRKEEEKAPSEKAAAIPEHALVALVAIEHSRPDWFQDDRFFTDPRVVAGGNSIPAKIQAIVRDTPLRSYRDDYLRISRGIQVR